MLHKFLDLSSTSLNKAETFVLLVPAGSLSNSFRHKDFVIAFIACRTFHLLLSAKLFHRFMLSIPLITEIAQGIVQTLVLHMITHD